MHIYPAAIPTLKKGITAMRRTNRPAALLLALCLAALCACGTGGAPAATEAPKPEVGGYDVPGEDAVPQESAAPTDTDGLEGSFYNDYLRLTLTLDGRGSCALTGSGAERVGTYAAGDGALRLGFPDGDVLARADDSGSYTLDGFTGRFLGDWDFWGITASEVGTASLSVFSGDSILDNGDGTLRCRDFASGVAFTFPADYSLDTGLLISAAAVRDGRGGCVTGRNVTDLCYAGGDDFDTILEDYVKTFVFADFDLLYGSLVGFESFTLLHEGIEGRLAAATLQMTDGETPIAVKAVLYTSTYADGTVNYICKTVFAPAESEGALEALAAAVTDMGAVRKAG